MQRDTIYLIIIAALLVIGYIFYKRSVKLARENQQKESIIAEKNAEITYRKNKEGELIADKLAAHASVKEISEAYPKIIEELKKDFDIKARELQAYVQNQFAAHGSGEGTVIHNYYDTLGKRYPRWEMKVNDGYLDFTADVIDTLSSKYTYTYTDTITTVIASRKKWIFGKETLWASSKLKNANAKVMGTTNILVDTFKDKRFGVGPFVGYSIEGKFAVGISLQYSLIKF